MAKENLIPPVSDPTGKLRKRLDAEVERTGFSNATIIRTALDNYLSEKEGSQVQGPIKQVDNVVQQADWLFQRRNTQL